MSIEKDGFKEGCDADIEREIRARRAFTPEEAIGRLAGPGAMKGASAISPQQQAENAVAAWLGANLNDPPGSLRQVLHRHIKAGKLLLEHAEEPLAAIDAHIRKLLGSEQWLAETVREADVEWGRSMGERPHFERAGSRPDTDDPYTADSVRKALEEALRQLSA